MRKYELIPHTADLGLRVFGRDLKELFSNAALGMMSQIVQHLEAVKGKETIEIALKALSEEELLVSWLNELLFKLSVDNWLTIEEKITSLEEKKREFFLTATVKGRKIDNKEKLLEREIKAATYHKLAIKKVNKGLETEIIFDV